MSSERAEAVAYVLNEAAEYENSDGVVAILEELADDLSRGEHMEASRHGELDDWMSSLLVIRATAPQPPEPEPVCSSAEVVEAVEELCKALLCYRDDVPAVEWERMQRRAFRSWDRVARAAAAVTLHMQGAHTGRTATLRTESEVRAEVINDASLVLDQYRAELRHDGRRRLADIVEECRDRVRTQGLRALAKGED